MPQANGAASGDNGPKKTDFLEIWDQLINAKAAVDSAGGRYRNVLARAEAGGHNVPMMKAALKLCNQDRDRRDSDFGDLNRMMRWLEKPLGYQADMAAEDEPEPTPEEVEAVEKHRANQARSEGIYAGRCGASIASTPYPPGSEQHSEWCNGWQEGQRQAVAEMGGPVRRGRPRAKAPTVEGEPARNA